MRHFIFCSLIALASSAFAAEPNGLIKSELYAPGDFVTTSIEGEAAQIMFEFLDAKVGSRAMPCPDQSIEISVVKSVDSGLGCWKKVTADTVDYGCNFRIRGNGKLFGSAISCAIQPSMGVRN